MCVWTFERTDPGTLKLKDTLLMLKAEAYAIARYVYSTAKQDYKEGVKGTEPIVKDLARQYSTNGGKGNNAEPTSEHPTPNEESATGENNKQPTA
ncbi:MAG: hypothetical protein GY765_12460 [bacterium]|nr:hypothetical protein [bacterium]